MNKPKRQNFESFCSDVFGAKEVVIVTHVPDDFGGKKETLNYVSIEEAKLIFLNLKKTIKEYERTSK